MSRESRATSSDLRIDPLLAAVLGLAASVILSAVAAQIVLSAGDYDISGDGGVGTYVGRVGSQRVIENVDPTPLGLPLWLTALLQIPLWVGLLGAVAGVAAARGQSIRESFRVDQVPSDVFLGFGVGLITQLILVPVLYIPIFWLIGEEDVSAAARSLTDRATSPIGIVVLVVAVALIAPVVEEVFFRGLLLQSLEDRMPAFVAIVLSALVFGAVHLQPLQFPALVLFGIVAGVLAHRAGRLGPAIWAHVGFNTVTLIVLLAS